MFGSDKLLLAEGGGSIKPIADNSFILRQKWWIWRWSQTNLTPNVIIDNDNTNGTVQILPRVFIVQLHTERSAMFTRGFRVCWRYVHAMVPPDSFHTSPPNVYSDVTLRMISSMIMELKILEEMGVTLVDNKIYWPWRAALGNCICRSKVGSEQRGNGNFL